MNKKQLAVVHIAKEQVGMDQGEYEALLSSVGVESSKDLSRKEFSIVMNHFEQLGFKSRSKHRSNHAPDDKKRILDKIDAILAEIGQERAYADGIAKNRFGVEQCHWLHPGQLRKVMQMLIYHQKRIRAKALRREHA